MYHELFGKIKYVAENKGIEVLTNCSTNFRHF